MLFNSIEFIIFISLVVSSLFLIRQRKIQHIFLVISSYAFFYYSSNVFLSLLIFSTVLDYVIANKIFTAKSISKKKILLIISLGANLGLLGFFKYVDFAILQFNIFNNYFNLSNEISYLNLFLPIGISFYTFQTISYTVDVYRGKLAPCKSFTEFSLFVAFFPQLVAGPILRAREFLPQLRDRAKSTSDKYIFRYISFENNNIRLGITLMAFGFFKKMFFADNIAPMVDNIFNSPIGLDSFTIILGAIGFGIQIYGDFSGYTDIAIGVALILGFKIPKNFNRPYFASSPSDFWRRWHISLSSWLRDYFYIPLGGSRISQSRTFTNLITVMVFGGLWHGASWNFILWGFLHGCYLIIYKAIQNYFPNVANNKFLKSRSGKVFSILITQYFVFLAWIPFRVTDLDSSLYSMHKYVFLDFKLSNTITFIKNNELGFLLIVLFIAMNLVLYKTKDHHQKIANWKIRYWTIFLIFMSSVILLFYGGNPEQFIYFKF